MIAERARGLARTSSGPGRTRAIAASRLGAAGALAIWDASRLRVPYSQADPIGPATFPYLVGGLLLVCAVVLAVRVVRGDHAPAEEGEDIEPGTPTDWKTVLPLIGVFLVAALVIDTLGWVLAGTLLFWGAVTALGSRHWVRDPLIAVALSLLTFYGFYLGLGIKLPAGILEGVL